MITIDNDLRTINIPSDTKFIGVVGDTDIVSLEFEMPSQYKGIDLSSYTVKIKYRNIERGRLRYVEGDYTPTDKTLTDDLINFSWLIGEEVCRYAGMTQFSICLSNGDSNDFNTRWAMLPVLKEQIPPIGQMKDSESLILDIEGLNFKVQDESLIVTRKEDEDESND